MCIDTNYFITEEDKLKDFICPIGKGIIVDPVYLNCTSSKTIHVFCKQCMENYEKSVSYYYYRCPICSSSYDKIEIVPYYQDVINNFQLKCESDSCEWRGCVEKYRDHRSSCEYRTVICPNDKCEEKIQQSMLEQHTNVCNFAKLDCVTCQKKYLRKDALEHNEMCKCADCENEYNKCIFSQHQSLCEHRIVMCWSCRETHKYIDKTTHVNSECPERLITCNYCDSVFHFKRQNDEENKIHKLRNKCEHCDEELQSCVMKGHIEKSCNLVPRECLICGQSYTKLTENKHMQDNTGDHLLLIYKKLGHYVDIINARSDTNCNEISSKISDVNDRLIDYKDEVRKVKYQLKKLSEHLNVTYDSD